MSATLMRPGRPHFANGDRLRGSAEEVRLANEGFLAYCGTYEVDEPRGIIVHHGARPQDEERKPMKCAVCGAQLRPTSSDLPFKIGVRAIVILRALPVLQCDGCTQYLIEDPVFARVEEILDRVGDDAELEVIRFVA